jgi:hypothetical protein
MPGHLVLGVKGLNAQKAAACILHYNLALSCIMNENVDTYVSSEHVSQITTASLHLVKFCKLKAFVCPAVLAATDRNLSNALYRGGSIIHVQIKCKNLKHLSD